MLGDIAVDETASITGAVLIGREPLEEAVHRLNGIIGSEDIPYIPVRILIKLGQ
ncbi:MAG: hypothetical protein ABIG61_06545 [Planctomycetota bacterium]